VIVLDASAAVDFLLRRDDRGDWVAARIAETDGVSAPHLLDTEVASAVRGLVISRQIPARAGAAALAMLNSMPLLRFPAYLLLERIWGLRDNLTAFDATYVALAEALGFPLVTTDQHLGRSAGHRAVVTAFPG